jgi:RNA polymerase sigma-70 factor (ECF subfamily)
VEERRRRVHAAVAALPPAYAQVVVLHYFRRLSYQAIAERLQISENSVKMRLFRAREKLREALADLV